MEETDWKFYKRGLDFRGDLFSAEKLLKSDAMKLFKKYGKKVLYIRNVYDYDSAVATSFWYIVRDREVQIEEYSTSKIRTMVRKSILEYHFELVPISEMRRIGYKVFFENWQRFPENNRPRLESEVEFKRYLKEQEKRGVEYWVGYSRESGDAAMWLSVYLVGSVAYFESIRFSCNYTRHNPTYGLHHVVSNYYIASRGVKQIISGARTVTQHSKAQDFNERVLMYRRAYCRFKLVLRFPYNLFVILFLPFRSLLPKNNKLRHILQLKSFEC